MAFARLEYAESEDYGYKGWKLKGHPVFDPATGRGIAHDLLEHAPSDRGTVIEEVRAIGAMAFVRYESGLVWESRYNNRPLHEDLGIALGSVFSDYIREHREAPDMSDAPHRSRALEYIEYDEMFAKALDQARKSFLADLSGDEDDEDTQRWVQQCFDGMARQQLMTALRTGFRRATQRYLNEAWRAAALFKKIDKAISEVSDEATIGDEIVVQYNIRDVEVRVHHHISGGYPAYR